jgi:hypothetical protein
VGVMGAPHKAPFASVFAPIVEPWSGCSHRDVKNRSRCLCDGTEKQNGSEHGEGVCAGRRAPLARAAVRRASSMLVAGASSGRCGHARAA